jgi:hypothetical protein
MNEDAFTNNCICQELQMPFFILDDLIRESNIVWSKCVGISTDGDCAMTGLGSGVVARVIAVSPEAKFVHYCIYKE